MTRLAAPLPDSPDAVISRLARLEPVTWINPRTAPAGDALADVGLSVSDIDEAADRLHRFGPYLAETFPDTAASGGVIESPLTEAPGLARTLGARAGRPFPGRLLLKRDSHLPISGSVKARGGIYEVLAHAEDLARAAGLLSLDDDYRRMGSPEVRALLGTHSVVVGSTGNLGLSIGIMSAALGFRVTVHMSSDARQWKKVRLREHGVDVVEHEGDYSLAVAAGRRQAEGNPSTYFVDDENSRRLFLGYAVAGRRLAAQLRARDVRPGAADPLVVYLPCGVGGAPGGIAFGLKTVYGDHVHAVFAEPTHSPAMLLGMVTGRHDDISVHELGIDNVTTADGLAVGRPSGFVGRRMARLVTGLYTLTDADMLRGVAQLRDTEGLAVEPSAAAGLDGALRLSATPEASRPRLSDAQLRNATHVAWLTGGSMVPRDELDGYAEAGRGLL
ncbi:D-serine ammonia-lyase [Microbacterium sp. P26]|uniref:D-serine ammonia-lyase n=1 Tax=Microbacterium TaxID=33882 RepID=UPI00203EF3B9|nr:D-serine ammonia-lyase [Microbacterium sp. P26]MCM3503122.1 D-serine ammonia-lyase [Microbacterium sp. P26]